MSRIQERSVDELDGLSYDLSPLSPKVSEQFQIDETPSLAAQYDDAILRSKNLENDSLVTSEQYVKNFTPIGEFGLDYNNCGIN